jgi:site-specific recombinase XerD
MVAHVDLLELREMMGHASITTTEMYLHYKPRNEFADKVAAAFAICVNAGAARSKRAG